MGGASISAPPTSKADAARKHIVSELLQTERNFVDILLIIVKVIKSHNPRRKTTGVYNGTWST